jgi:hypothetical protein
MMQEPIRVTECGCFYPAGPKWGELRAHDDEQDRNHPAWFKLLEAIDEAVQKKAKVFSLRQILPDGEWMNITTLPPEIGRLKDVESLNLYGCNLVRIPPEIGQMESLEHFVPYTSYRLHWFPFEITKCQKLRNSTVSTRALYGNYKFRPPFPSLRRNPIRYLDDQIPCSVCGRVLEQSLINQMWISLRVATDVLPLLANLCSKACFETLPEPADGYLKLPHKGGLGQAQPLRGW